MFYKGVMGVFFAELEAVQESKAAPLCQKCSKPLPRKGQGQRGPGGVKSFWLIRCADPDCRQPHIIFNSTSVLPEVTAGPPETPPLIDFKKLLKDKNESDQSLLQRQPLPHRTDRSACSRRAVTVTKSSASRATCMRCNSVGIATVLRPSRCSQRRTTSSSRRGSR